jgi:hypothetical protein
MSTCDKKDTFDEATLLANALCEASLNDSLLEDQPKERTLKVENFQYFK